MTEASDSSRLANSGNTETILTTDRYVMGCPICGGPLTACFNPGPRVGWAQCFAGGHEYIENIFSPDAMGSETGRCFVGLS